MAVREPRAASSDILLRVLPISPAALLTIAFVGVALVVLLITWARIPAFLALALAALFVGLATRMPLADIPRAFQAGMGDTLGSIAMVIGLGTIIGKLLAESGGAMVVSKALADALGERRLDWALLLSGFIIGLPVFFQVGLVLLAPVLFTAQRQTRTPLLQLGLPMVAGLSAAHGLVPPHPGPLAAIERLGADPGRTLFYSLILGLPLAILSGPIYARYICRRVHVEPGAIAEQFTDVVTPARTPTLAVTVTTMLMPVLLMLFASAAQIVMPDSALRRAIIFCGSPLVAMMLATVLSLFTFGRACGFDRTRLLKFAEESLPPIAGVLLVVGAGGGFGRVLVLAHVDTAISQAMAGLQLSPLVLGWVIASLLRVSVGSATVSVITAASIMAPIVAGMPHVNDGGFWLVEEYLNMSVPQTLATWTVIETIIAVVGLGGVLLLSVFVG